MKTKIKKKNDCDECRKLHLLGGSGKCHWHSPCSCFLCGAAIDSVDEAAYIGWIPSFNYTDVPDQLVGFYADPACDDSQEILEVVCVACCDTYLYWDEEKNGGCTNWFLRPEFYSQVPGGFVKFLSAIRGRVVTEDELEDFVPPRSSK